MASKIYMTGGYTYDYSTFYSDAAGFDIYQNAWWLITSLTPITNRVSAARFGIDDNSYVANGNTSSNTSTTTGTCFNLTTETSWQITSYSGGYSHSPCSGVLYNIGGTAGFQTAGVDGVTRVYLPWLNAWAVRNNYGGMSTYGSAGYSCFDKTCFRIHIRNTTWLATYNYAGNVWSTDTLGSPFSPPINSSSDSWGSGSAYIFYPNIPVRYYDWASSSWWNMATWTGQTWSGVAQSSIEGGMILPSFTTGDVKVVQQYQLQYDVFAAQTAYPIGFRRQTVSLTWQAGYDSYGNFPPVNIGFDGVATGTSATSFDLLVTRTFDGTSTGTSDAELEIFVFETFTGEASGTSDAECSLDVTSTKWFDGEAEGTSEASLDVTVFLVFDLFGDASGDAEAWVEVITAPAPGLTEGYEFSQNKSSLVSTLISNAIRSVDGYTLSYLPKLCSAYYAVASTPRDGYVAKVIYASSTQSMYGVGALPRDGYSSSIRSLTSTTYLGGVGTLVRDGYSVGAITSSSSASFAGVGILVRDGYYVDVPSILSTASFAGAGTNTVNGYAVRCPVYASSALISSAIRPVDGYVLVLRNGGGSSHFAIQDFDSTVESYSDASVDFRILVPANHTPPKVFYVVDGVGGSFSLERGRDPYESFLARHDGTVRTPRLSYSEFRQAWGTVNSDGYFRPMLSGGLEGVTANFDSGVLVGSGVGAVDVTTTSVGRRLMVSPGDLAYLSIVGIDQDGTTACETLTLTTKTTGVEIVERSVMFDDMDYSVSFENDNGYLLVRFETPGRESKWSARVSIAKAA
jgi:hypothetical protein